MSQDITIFRLAKKLLDKCESLKENETCTEKVKSLINLPQAKHFRLIKPNMAVTMDYSPNRVNITVDKDSKITEITIG